MTAYVGSNKIKDTGAYGVYFCPGKTNCLTYTPKNVNLTLSNGTLTLKKGSKVYVPNGKNADGSNKFDEVVIGSDLQASFDSATNDYFVFIQHTNELSVIGCRYFKQADIFSGENMPTITSNYAIWYDTVNNIIKETQDKGATWKTDRKFSLPTENVTTSKGFVTSINQIFDWCGYIGNTAFVLPGVKGLIPNGFNADGTYKSVEYTVPRVLTGYHGGQINATLTVDIGRDYLSFWNISSVHTVSSLPAISSTDYSKCYLTTENKQYYHAGTEFDGWREFYEIMPNTRMVTDSNGKITSLTPCSVKTTNDLQAINAIYNGSQKVYQYLPTGKTFNPSGSFQTYVVPKGVNKLQVDCVAAKGNGNGYGGRVQCVLSVTPGQTLYLAVGSANTSAATPTYNASDIRTNANGITDTTSLQSRLVVAGGGGNTGNQAGTGGHGGGLTGAAGSDVDGKSGQGGSQSAGGAGGANGYWGEAGAAGGFGLGGRGGNGVGGAGGAGWYGGGGAGASAYGSTLGGNGGGGSSYTNPSLCTNVSHTQGYRNGNGYITLTPVR